MMGIRVNVNSCEAKTCLPNFFVEQLVLGF
jgi:hypothetical protein